MPCKGYRSSQLINWSSSDGTGPKSHLCNGILDCIDRSDESGCKDTLGSSEVNEGIEMQPNIAQIRRQPRITLAQLEVNKGKRVPPKETDCNGNFTFNQIYKGRCKALSGRDVGCNTNITSGRHESQCSNSKYDNYTSTFINLG